MKAKTKTRRELSGKERSKKTRWLSFLLSIIMMISMIPLGCFSVKAQGLSLRELKDKFPQNTYWNHVGSSSNNENGYTYTPCPSHSSTSTCNAFTYGGTKIGWQCFGFALKLGYDAYGTNPKNWGRAYNLNNIKAGDIINYNGCNPGHTVFVTAVNGDKVSFAECNYGSRCIIRWDRSLKKSEFNNLYNVYVAPYELPSGSSNHSISGLVDAALNAAKKVISNSVSFSKPISSATVQGIGYEHPGVDLHAPIGTPVYAVANGTIQYSEWGHTVNKGSHETAYSVKIKLDKPFTRNGVKYICAYYTHMSKLVYDVPEKSNKSNTIHVKPGDLIGYSGTANYCAHLHFSFEGDASSNYKMMYTTDVCNMLGISRGEKWNTGGSINPPTSSSTGSYSTGIYKVTGCTNSGKLNVRSTPGGAWVGNKYQGNELRITDVSGFWGKCDTGWVSLEYCTYMSALEPEIKVPAAPAIRLTTEADCATGTIITVNWPAVSDANGYTLYMKNSSGTVVQKIDWTTGTTATFMVNEGSGGTYSIYGYAGNSKYTSTQSNVVTVNCHDPSLVNFVDYNGSLLCSQKVKYGSSAVLPSVPNRYGFTFSGWSGSYTNVKSNQTVTAQYTRNKYTVKFFNEDGKLIDTQKVYYEYAATAPSYEPNSGYDFVSWDKSFNYITEDTNVTAVVKWYNEDMSVIVSDMDAVREKDGTGVTVTYSISNQKNEITSARAIITLKTSEGKLVTTTESSAFSIKNNVTKSQEVFVPTTDGAYKAEVYIVANYKTAVPVSESVSKVINQQGENWTSWSTSVPPEGSLDVQSRTEYRFRDKKFTTSSASSMSGWNYYNTTFVWSDYGPWSSWTDSSISKTDYRDVDTQEVYLKTQYNYYHYSLKKKNGSTTTAYCGMAGYNSTTSGMGISPAVSETYHTTGWLDYQLTYLCQDNWNDGWKNAYSGISCCKYGISGPDHWYYLGSRDVTKKQYRYRGRSKIYTYHFWKWGDWSDWTATSVSANDNRAVETRTTYRYKTNEIIGTEDNTGVIRTISGKVSESYAGKDALLIIYKVDEASDYSNQYVEQIKIGDDGTYSATFKLLTEPTVKSGDYTVTLGVAGTNEAIYIDTIEAPKPEYTVTFFDEDGTIISEQNVIKGNNASIPEAPEKEGFHFVYWDSTATNVQSDLDIYAHYEINTYTVVFVNWSEETVSVHTYEHGQPIAPPEINDTESSKAISWDSLVEGPVTDNMIVTAKYKTKTFNVKFIDWNNNLVSSQTVEYGQTAEVPDDLSEKDYIFYNWASDGDYTYVTEDTIVVPSYLFEQTTANPIISIENGDYDTEQTVTITCPTEKAVIYYTIDGSDPNEEGAIEYTGPITIDRTCELRVVATAFHMNNSSEEKRYIAINTDHMTSEWVQQSEIPDYVMNNLKEYNLVSETGYKYKDLQTASSQIFANSLEADGWTFESEEYSEYSQWFINNDPRENGMLNDLINPEVEERLPDPEDTNLYQYSRWKYQSDGNVKYSRMEIQGIEGNWEYLKLANKLSISEFDGTAPGYSYNGEVWYNQTIVIEKVVPDYKLYRFRSKMITYSKWTSWSIDNPSQDETREFLSEEVYQYTAPKKFVVALDITDDEIVNPTEYFFNDANQLLCKSSEVFEVEGYELLGAYTGTDYSESWDFAKNTVNESVTLLLKWTPKQYTVTFVGFDDEVVDTQKVTFLEYAEIPIFEEVDGYVFCGLDTDSMLVTGDMTVKAKYVKEEDYVKLSLNKTSYALYTGSSVDLVATVTPETAENKDVIWRSSDDNIAYVDDMGKVTAINEGTVTIYATCCETGYTESCEITVSKNVDDSIVISPKAKVSVDDANQLRGIKVDANTVNEVKELFVNDNLRFFDATGEEIKDESLVGTGTVIKLMSGYTTLDTLTVVLTGDMNCDGKVNNRDVAMGTRYLVEKEAFGLAQVTAFDVNGDGKVNNRDAAMLSRYLVGKETL